MEKEAYVMNAVYFSLDEIRVLKKCENPYRSNCHQPVVNPKGLHHSHADVASQEVGYQRCGHKRDVDSNELWPSVWDRGRVLASFHHCGRLRIGRIRDSDRQDGRGDIDLCEVVTRLKVCFPRAKWVLETVRRWRSIHFRHV